MEELSLSTLLQKGIYVEDKQLFEKRAIVVFNDKYLDIRNINYDTMLQHMVEKFTNAIDISKKNNNCEDFVILVYLNPKRKNSINKKSMVQMVIVLNSLFKKNLYKCIFINYNIYFKFVLQTIKPLLETSLRKKFIFSNITKMNLQYKT